MKTGMNFFSVNLIVFFTLLLSAIGFGQTIPLEYYTQTYSLESGYFNGTGNPTSNPVMVFSDVLELHNIPWLRLHFSDANLGEESYIIVKSLQDDLWQKIDAVSIEQWNYYSAFFNGSAVEISLFIDPLDEQVFFNIDEVIAGVWTQGNPYFTICGTTDDRTPSNQPATARLLNIGCTAWIIPNGKFISAGHCLDGSNSTVVEFNVPLSLPGGTIQHPDPEDQYSVNVATKVYVNGGIGNDWGVFEVFPNSITGLMPKEAQSAYWPLVQDLGPASIRITGYGVDDGTANQTQQTHVGPNAGSSGTTMRYVTDTQGGNSGSPVIDALTNNAVGVHTHGGCTSSGGNNNGTSTFHTAFWAAVDEGTGDVTDPTNVSATPISDSQINVGFTPDSYNNNVVIVWNDTGTFTTPSGTPPAPDQPFAGGILLYNGITSPVNHTGLTHSTTYHYKAFSNSGVSYSPGVTSNASTFSVLDFGVELTVSDSCGNNSHSLIFGTAPGATECYDAGLDLSAPPSPPLGVIDGRFGSCGEHFFTDIRGTNPDGERIWDIQYRPNAGCSPVSLSWNPAELPVDGYFHLVDPILGTLVNVNMRTTDNYTDALGLGQLQIKFNYEICSNFNVSNGWNMLSLPVGVSNNNYLTLFPTAVTGTLYGYSGTYVTTETMENGAGYWLKFPSSEFVEVCGSDITESIIELEAGWNMIGGPNCNVPLSSVIDPGGIIIAGALYGYSGSYTTASSIDATKGYWIKTNAGGTITISCSTPLSNNIYNSIYNSIISAESLTDFGMIKITDASELSQTLYFNGDLNEEINIESYSMPPVPPPGSFDARLVGDYRLAESDEVNIQLQATDYPVSIMITNLNLTEEYVLVEMANGVEVGTQKITEGSEIIIRNEEVSLLKITKEQSLPTTYNLEQNYPNPFNPSTTIKFSLPEATNVTLRIYNTLGQKITELVNTNLEAGWYNYQWDATNLATGIYIYELRTDKFILVKKMILMK